jgi:hypothetical protein
MQAGDLFACRTGMLQNFIFQSNHSLARSARSIGNLLFSPLQCGKTPNLFFLKNIHTKQRLSACDSLKHRRDVMQFPNIEFFASCLILEFLQKGEIIKKFHA